MSDSDVVIRVEGLGKSYALHHEKGERYTALRDVVARQARAAGRLLNPFTLAGQLRKAQREAAAERAGSEEEFWALKDVSFEIRRGERVGIIGRNGAGKSTLLKILSRITEPTTGRVEIRGRVASLLEVGTGFHPELTGRENIYLNGAILGMTRREIRTKFDEIVDFAEVEKFLDTPVKRYSSGMYVRLAFAVAAHLEPEILVVDEVLAVGDARFQQKCLGKMEDVADKQNRTVFFVSHQMGAIQRLCTRALLIHTGSILYDGKTTKAIEFYSSEGLGSNDIKSIEFAQNRKGSGELLLIDIKPIGGEFNGRLAQSYLQTGSPAIIRLEYRSNKAFSNIEFGIVFSSLTNEDKMVLSSKMSKESLSTSEGDGFIECRIKKLPLQSGRYSLRLFAAQSGEILDWILDAGTIDVRPGFFYETMYELDSYFRTVLVENEWTVPS